ncbi:hypothetical protein QBC47DRAFT_387288 [Echria macrotheca]|uniref:Prolyl 4-hydroxylase alpha subunit Fe(2+) 2OG dioxygenase domain-containing protein n=1 Tax=Echria macrotheca TaxID=438768 RepID=A0AAJ0B7X5_9PEZI|nr:hypothetical protein QBC47DRAFT_387288 [Echria macrotheca]
MASPASPASTSERPRTGTSSPASSSQSDASHDHDDNESVSSDLSTVDYAYHETLHKDLFKALGAIEAAGSFAGFAKLPDMQPELSVADVGPVNLPLDELTARKIIEKARQAPFGKGSETIVDVSVRNTWELDPSQFTIGNPEWNKVIKRACKFVAKTLGVKSPISAELYKMLVYEKGAFFKAHTDTEKIPGMFGSLVVCLPSPHEGGDVIVKHHGERKTFRTSIAPEGSVLCWYGDVRHEVTPVISGYRFVLTYNLAIPPDAPLPSAAVARAETSLLRHTLRRYVERSKVDGNKEPEQLYYRLDYEYTEANISLKNLKDRDLAVAQTLVSISSEVDLDVFLGEVERTDRGEVEMHYGERDDLSWHDLADDPDTEISVSKLVDIHGRELTSNIDIGDSFWNGLIRENEWEDVFDGADCGERDYEGYQGNWGPNATHWYRVWVIVIAPRGPSSDLFVLDGIEDQDLQPMLRHFLRHCFDPKRRDNARRTVHRLIKDAWGDKSPFFWVRKPDPKIVACVIETVLVLKDYDLFNHAIKHLKGAKLPALLKSVMLFMAEPDNNVDFDKIRDSLLQHILAIPLTARATMLNSILTNGRIECPAIRDWVVDDIIPACLDASKTGSPSESDGEALVTMISQFQDFEYIKTKVLPLAEERISFIPFVLAAILQVLELATNGRFETEQCVEAAKLCQPILKSTVNSMKVQELIIANTDFAKLHKTPRYDYDTKHSEAYASVTITPKLLASLCSQCLQYGWDGLLMVFSLKVVQAVDSISETVLGSLWVPFLKRLVGTLEHCSVPLTTPRYRHLACAILSSYGDKFVSKEPSGTADRSQPPLVCSCHRCAIVNNFLRSRVEDKLRIPMSLSDIRHIQEEFSLPCKPWYVSFEGTTSTTLVLQKDVGRRSNAKTVWESHLAQYTSDIAEFDQAKLKQLLGEEYDQITTLSHLRRHPRVQPSATGPSSRAVTQPAASRVIAPLLNNQRLSGGGMGSLPFGGGPLPPLPAIPPPLAGMKRPAGGPHYQG